jgi:hypothetical protein
MWSVRSSCFRWTWSRDGSPLRSANCDQGPDEGRNSADRESLVASFGAFVAFGDVSRQATGEGQHLAPFAGNVSTEIPGVGAREEGSVRQGEHLRSPRFLRRHRCLDPRVVVLAKVIQQPSDPVSLNLCAGRPVAESVRALRAINEEKIRKACHCHSELGANALRPLLLQLRRHS